MIRRGRGSFRKIISLLIPFTVLLIIISACLIYFYVQAVTRPTVSPLATLGEHTDIPEDEKLQITLEQLLSQKKVH